MFSNTFEIGVQSTRKDSFVSISASFIKQAIVPLYGNKLPYCVPLKLTGKDGKCCYVGCLTSQDIPGKSNRISLSPTLASDLGLSSGEVVSCVPVSKAPRATRVLVDPFNVDESEVVEHNALRIEANLLRQIQVVYPGMTVTVNISAGLVAKVRVRLIECGEGNELKEGCAVMFDGTLFVVATRARDSDDAKGDTTPLSAIVRARPSSAATAVVGADVAARYRWTTGLEVGLLNLGHLALEKEPKMTPSFLRAHMVLAKLTVEEEEGGDGVALPGLDQPSNVLVIPNPGAVARVNEADASGEGEIEARLTLPAIQEVTAKVVIPSLEQLKAVHDKTLDELQSVLRYAFTSSDKGSVLLSGGKGFGKTVLSRCVCRWAEEEATVHTEYLDCVESKTFLDHLKSTLKRCVLCAPSMLVLDNLDRLAPSQEEGHVQSMSEVTRSVFDLVLSNTDRLSPVVEDHKITILATCASKDNLNERFRSPYCFQTNMALEPLRRPTRQSLLAQILPGVEEETLQKMVALMDNYTPFDVVHIAPRITKLYAERKQKGERNVTLQDCAEASVRDFTPLAHGGISFLKGEKRDWDLIGGLSEAKKALYDTLVLPMKHPEIFAKLPLKTRSGLLLYGPSGCGKTFILESIVNSHNLNCVVVNGPEVFGKYIGQSEQKIREVFERAQAAAPCVVFFDEFESVAPQRGADNSGVTDRVVNQLLCYLDGVESRKDVYVVAASSRPDLIDAALLRPGRLDKAVQCPVPTLDDRVAILTYLLGNIGATLNEVQIKQVAASTERWTPADLASVVSTANTLVNRRIIERLTAGALRGNADDKAKQHQHFYIANIGQGLTEENIADAFRHLESNAGVLDDACEAIRVSLDDVLTALETSRASLTDKDIATQNRIHRLFSLGEKQETVPAGSKVITV